jgi:class 3 adenylate cyclase/tetratricopeptide (TPR) repeat protein
LTPELRFCPACGTERVETAASREQRRTVTVVFCDLAGSTALGESVDPERLRALLAGYFERMKAIVVYHGGSVEKFIGDAVMAVFGVPTVHEDDALRAVRAAAEMRDALPELGLQGRIGVMTGEVIAGTEERLVTGDAVNVAARLEQAAQPGEVLIGETTLELVREAVDVEPLEPLDLKGKTEPVAAHRLVAVHDAPERRHDTPFVGRERELGVLREAAARVSAERRCELVTIVGEAGVGKSRLVAEALASARERVMRGRCIPYGEGITYWPVVEVLKQLDTRPPDEAAAVAIRSLLRESDKQTSADEIAWAFRKTLEHAAATQPVVIVFDDIQWGEQTFHDLVEHVALLSTGAPILLLCMARPELVEQHPIWPVTIRLEPLPDNAVDELIPERLPDDLRARIAHAAGGNPLFVGEMLAMAAETDGEVVVPPTLQALLAARLDQLEQAERRVLECGSIEGETFHRGAVQALAPADAHVTPHLATLVRKQLIRPDKTHVPGDDAYRFHHILLRDAAYDSLPKARRAELHQRFAAWLELHGTAIVELDELLGYHLEQACRYRHELGLAADSELAGAARRRLTAAGQRAGQRQDYDAAVSLFERAAALVPPREIDLVLEAELGDVLCWAGRGDDALERAVAVAERAAAAGDPLGALCGRLMAGVQRLLSDTDDGQALAELVEEALPVVEAFDDPMAMYVVYAALGEAAAAQGRHADGLDAYEQAFAHARRAGYEPSSALATLSWHHFVGPTPTGELIAWLDEIEQPAGPNQFVRAYRGWTLAKLGRFDEARAIIAEARAQQAERGGGLLLANLTAFESTWVELLAGDPSAAVGFGVEGFRLHEELGDVGFMASSAATLAEALYELGRLEEAETWVDRAVALTVADMWTQLLWRQVRAKVLARRGEHADAERLAREAAALADEIDMIDAQGMAYADLAEVLSLGGKPGEAAAALEQALDRFDRKGNLVMAQRVRERLSEVEDMTAR